MKEKAKALCGRWQWVSAVGDHTDSDTQSNR